jgi:cobalt/nickel transport system permease protein
MHIPDGYLSPETCAATALASAAVLTVAARRFTATVRLHDVPTLALGTAASFLIMMINVPVPGGTTAHATGAVILAVLFGPWAAAIALSISLALQALLFGDGGVLTLGANVLTIAVVMPFVGYAAYRLVAGRSPPPGRRLVAAGVGAYVGVNVAALVAAVMLGIQPILFRGADGAPLYSPYPMGLTVTMGALTHLTVAGAAEVAVTVAAIAYLARIGALGTPTGRQGATADPAGRRGSPRRRVLAVLLALVVVAPVGLLASGEAFGEAAPEDLPLTELGLRAVPAGMERFTGFWQHALLADYGLGPGAGPVAGYWLSALVGLVVVGLLVAGTGAALGRGTRRVRQGHAAPLPTSNATSRELPGWLLTAQPPIPFTPSGRRRRRSGLEATLGSTSRLLHQLVAAEGVGRAGAPDPRVTLGALLAGLVTVALVRERWTLVAILGAVVALAACARVPLGSFLRRLGVVVALNALVVLPVALSPVVGGPLAATLWTWQGTAHGLTSTGLTSASQIVLRVACSVGLVLLVAATTPGSRLVAAVGRLGAPPAVTLTLTMAHRYLSVLATAMEEMSTSLVTRTVAAEHGDRGTIGPRVGALLAKSQVLSGEVHQAMVARGYRGRVRTLDPRRVGRGDVIALALALGACALALVLDGAS